MEKKELLAKIRQELLEMAARLSIRGRSRMNKAQLAEAIFKASKAGGNAGGNAVDRQTAGAKKTTGNRRKALGRNRAGARRSGRRPAAPIREAILVRRSWREQQAVVQQAKYEAEIHRPPGKEEPVPEPSELPAGYDVDRIVLLVRDPYWLHTFWDITRKNLLRAREDLGDEWKDAKSVLRVYDVTGLDFDGTNAHSYFDIEVAGGANNWYVNTRVPNRTYLIEIGLLAESGRFVVLARSNRATTPRDAPSEITDEEWMIPDWEFEKVYALSGGFQVGTGSIELKDLMEKALGGETSSGAPGSLGVTSPAGGGRRQPGAGRAFWFRLGTELIVYGATEPDARVTLEGRPVKLRPDGTFTVRYSLPDGERVIPAAAESADGVERIEITPIVKKRTEK
jgi:hypothetical protein